jgi:glycosyltransferase involved in cell wall biosynthesis
MIEAMACGTPVIAYGSGSVPEVVEHGLTGFIVDSEVAAAATIDHQLGQLSRRKIRARFEERFTARRMAHDYLEVYRGLTAGTEQPLRKVNGSAKSAHRHQSGIDGGVYLPD